MRKLREKIAWIIAGTLALGVALAVATAVSGGSLDPPGPPSDTGPLQAVMIPPEGRLIQIADDVLVPTSAVSIPEPTNTPTAAPATNTPAPTNTVPIGQLRQFVSFTGNGTVEPTVEPIPGVSVDCGACTFASGTGTITVDIEFTNNSGASIQLGAMNFNLLGDNQSSLNPTRACAAPGTACNPNLILSDGSWSCGPPNPVADTDASATATNPFISCFNGGGTGESVANGATITLARVTYTGGTDGVTNLTLSAVNVADALGVEVHSCAPGADICNSATVQIGDSAATNTPTPLSTSTATPFPSATPCGGPDCPTRTSLAFITVTPTPPPGPSGSAIDLGHHDVSDCAELTLFVEAVAAPGQTGSSSLQMDLQLSATDGGRFGVLRFDGNQASWTVPVSSPSTTQTQRATLFGQQGQDAPFVGVFASVVSGAEVDVRIDAWLYCIPRT